VTTSPMTLPFPPRRAHLTAFWLGLNLPILPLAALVPVGGGGATRALLAVALLASTLTAGFLWREAPLYLYRVWNKAAVGVALVGRRWVLAASYYLVISAAARGGSRLELALPSGSMWRPYGSRGPDGDPARAPGRGWVRRLLEDARRPEHGWRLSLVPFLVLLSWLHVETSDEDVPSNVYTLY
jgi:hypothetical protein